MTMCLTYLDGTRMMMQQWLEKNLVVDVTDNLNYYQKAFFVVAQIKSTNVVNWLEDQFLNEKTWRWMDGVLP